MPGYIRRHRNSQNQRLSATSLYYSRFYLTWNDSPAVIEAVNKLIQKWALATPSLDKLQQKQGLYYLAEKIVLENYIIDMTDYAHLYTQLIAMGRTHTAATIGAKRNAKRIPKAIQLEGED